MPANIDTMAFTGQVPWHRTGTKLDHPMTAEEAITAGGLTWEVVKEPTYCGTSHNVVVKDRFVVRRSDRLNQTDGGQLGVVGRDYTPLQNKEAFNFLDPLVVGGRAIYHTVGALDGGKRVWLLAKLPGEIKVAGDDIAEKFLLLSNSHDGSSAVRIIFTPIRVVCQNTLNLALRDTSGLCIRHHSDVHERIQHAYKLLSIVNTVYDRAAIMMKGMVKVPLTADRLKSYIEDVMPLPTDAEIRTKVQQRHGRIAELFEIGDGNKLPGVRGTLWAAYNAVTQWTDRESYTPRLKDPLKSIWFGQGRMIKERAFDLAARMLVPSMN